MSVDPQCSKSRVGLPACDFNKYNCFKEPEGEKSSWIHVPFGTKGPVDPIERMDFSFPPRIYSVSKYDIQDISLNLV